MAVKLEAHVTIAGTNVIHCTSHTESSAILVAIELFEKHLLMFRILAILLIITQISELVQRTH